MQKSLRLGAFLLISVLAVSCDSSPVEDPGEDEGPYPSLSRRATFPVGVALQARHLNIPAYTSVLEHAFNSITAEYEMKARTIWQGPGRYNWTAPDRLVSYAEGQDMRVHGHALVWHSSTPDFIQNFSGTDEEFEGLVRDYITAVVSRYKGRIASWDVVNEAFADGSGLIRNSPFRRYMGTDFVTRCFEYARAADPDLLLFYNDYGTIWDQRKREAMFSMIDDFLARGVPIDGIGLQMHISHDWPSMTQMRQTVDGIVERGLRVHISELDIKINRHGDLEAPTDERLESQKRRVQDIVSMFRQIPEHLQHGITFWGLRDPDSWLINFEGRPEWALLFDENYDPKPAYFGFLEAL